MGMPPAAGHGNGVFFQAINIADFLPLEEFHQHAQSLVRWVKSSRPAPGVAEVLMPGEPEHRTTQQRLRDGFAVDDSLWQAISELAGSLGVIGLGLA